MKTNRGALLGAVADYAATCAIESDSAIETARHCLIRALGCGFEALRDPECAAQIGPLVPGAVMPGGARVPGTSLELEPAQAAFCTGLMLCWPAAGDQGLASGGARAPEPLGAILAIADYQARKAMMEGKPPPKVREVLTAIIKTVEIQGVLAARDESPHDAKGTTLRCARIATSAIVAAQLGGTREQIITAVSYACMDGDGFAHPDEPYASGHARWAAAEAIGRGVRHACQVTAPGRPTPADMRLVNLADQLLAARPAPASNPFGTALVDRLGGRRKPQDVEQLTASFQAAVDRYFPVRQAERVKALFAAPARLDDLPVNELMAALVTNGAR